MYRSCGGEIMDLVSGYGSSHTNKPDAKNRTPYETINWYGIQARTDNPQEVDKPKAQWIIPSSYLSPLSRQASTQKADGVFHLLWADLDHNTLPIKAIADIVEGIFHSDFEAYTSRSATKELIRCRILVPLLNPMGFEDWLTCQTIFNDKLRSLSIEPDVCNLGCAHVFYLPNKGKYYDNDFDRAGEFFNPLDSWVDEIEIGRGKLQKARMELEELTRCTTVKAGTGLIETFNDTFKPHEILIKAGYSQRGNTFCHPESAGGSYSANVKLNEFGVLRVHTLSTSDPLWVEGSKSGHDAFSCFTVLVHGGDINAALRDAGDNLIFINGLSFNKASQTEYAKKQELPNTGKPFTLKSFSITGESKQMETSLLDEHFVLKGIALRGQMTVLYAKPNTGKTLISLWLLIQSINEGSIDAKHIFYVNADDDYRGLITKTKLAEQYGFEMLSPSYKGFTAVLAPIEN